jgi:uncharacterized protein (DUF362 family)
MNYYLDRLRRAIALKVARKPRGLELLPPQKRKENVWQREGEVLVSRVEGGEKVRDLVERSVELLGGFNRIIKMGQSVMIKPNFNRSNPPPASTALDFLEAVIVSLKERGAEVMLGECSGPPFVTRRNLEARGVIQLLHRLGVGLVIFNESEWVKVRLGGAYLSEIIMAKSAYKVDTLVYLPNMKTHRKARFSLSLKLAVGFTHPAERMALHEGMLEEKISEINLAWQPDLIIMDGRKAFVTVGPDEGEVVEPGVIMASGDMVAVDLEALKILTSYKANNRLDLEPAQFPQIKIALERGLGKERYTLVNK